MRRRSGRLLIVTALAVLGLSAPASADELIDTITVDPGSTSVAYGAATLQKGTRYVLEVDGLSTTMNTQANVGYRYDALYCYEGVNFQTPQCQRTGPSDHSSRNNDFKIGVGEIGSPARWAAVDAFTRPLDANPYDFDLSDDVDYNPNHSYSLAFYPPETGKLRASGFFARGECNGCTTAVTGSFTIKVFGPGATPAPQPTATPSPGPGGGGGSTPLTPCENRWARISRVCDDTIAVPDAGVQFAPPGPGEAVRVQTPLDPGTKQLIIDAGILDAETQELIGSLLVKLQDAKTAKFREQFYGCLMFAGFSASADFEFKVKWDPGSGVEPTARASAIAVACATIISREAAAAAAKPASAAAAKCKLGFRPLTLPSMKGKAKRRYVKKARKLRNRKVRWSCDRGSSGQLSIKVRAVGKHTLNELLGDAPVAAFARKAPKSAKNGPKATMYVTAR